MSRFLPRFCLSTFFTGSFGAECEIDRQKLCAGPTRVCPPTNGERQRKGRVCLFLGVLCCCYHVYLCGISSGSFCLLLLCVFVCVFFFRCCSYPIQKHGKLKTTDALGRTKTTIIGQPKRQQQQRGHGQQQRTGTRAEREKNQQRAIFSPKKKQGATQLKTGIDNRHRETERQAKQRKGEEACVEVGCC